MTAADDALDRLVDCERRHWAPDPNRWQIANEFDEALATVRDELQRLRDDLADEMGLTEQQRARAEEAEAEVQRLREDKVKLHDWGSYWKGKSRQLEDGLREIADYQGEPSASHAWDSEMRDMARTLLAEDGEA